MSTPNRPPGPHHRLLRARHRRRPRPRPTSKGHPRDRERARRLQNRHQPRLRAGGGDVTPGRHGRGQHRRGSGERPVGSTPPPTSLTTTVPVLTLTPRKCPPSPPAIWPTRSTTRASPPPTHPLLDLPLSALRAALETDIPAPLAPTQAIFPLLRAPPGGGGFTRRATPRRRRNCRMRCTPFGVHVVTLYAGGVETELWANLARGRDG